MGKRGASGPACESTPCQSVMVEPGSATAAREFAEGDSSMATVTGEEKNLFFLSSFQIFKRDDI